MKAEWLVLRQLQRRMAHRFFHLHKTNSGTSIALAPTDLNTAAFIYANREISTSNEDSMTTVHQNLYVLGLTPLFPQHEKSDITPTKLALDKV